MEFTVSISCTLHMVCACWTSCSTIRTCPTCVALASNLHHSICSLSDFVCTMPTAGLRSTLRLWSPCRGVNYPCLARCQPCTYTGHRSHTYTLTKVVLIIRLSSSQFSRARCHVTASPGVIFDRILLVVLWTRCPVPDRGLHMLRLGLWNFLDNRLTKSSIFGCRFTATGCGLRSSMLRYLPLWRGLVLLCRMVVVHHDGKR